MPEGSITCAGQALAAGLHKLSLFSKREYGFSREGVHSSFLPFWAFWALKKKGEGETPPLSEVEVAQSAGGESCKNSSELLPIGQLPSGQILPLQAFLYFRQKNKRTEDLSAMGKECRSV